MDCAQFREIVHDFERTGPQGFALRESALTHAEVCPSCDRLLEEVTQLDFALDSVAMEDRSEQAPQHVEAAVMGAFRRQHAGSRRNFGLIQAWGIAAAVALAFGMGIWRWMPSKGNVAVKSPVDNGTAPAVPSALPDRDNAQVEAKGSPDVVSQTAVGGESEYATNFVPLPYADDPGTLDGGTVVRVTLSRDALASFGIPVADLNPGERIPADIALSMDGVPQAIRLVADENVAGTN